MTLHNTDPSPEPFRPNVLWICTDQQRWDTIAALGNDTASTPAMDSLVAEGVAFTTAYCQSPMCTPSRASFLTGDYPSAIHWTRNGNETAPPAHPALITKRLADVGYTVGLVGKLHLASAYGRTEQRTDDGIATWKYSHAPRDDWAEGHSYADWVAAKGSSLRALIDSDEGIPTELHQSTWCADETIKFISDSEGPWFATVNFYDPHPPFNPPREYLSQFDPADMPWPSFGPHDLEQQERLAAVDFQSKPRHPSALDLRSPAGTTAANDGVATASTDARILIAAYYAMIKLVDDQLGRILDYLSETNDLDNTLIIFSSDHGESLGDHGLIQKGCRFYEGLVRVPLLMRLPAVIPDGVRVDALVELTDIAPTILDILGLPGRDEMQGRSLIAAMHGAPHRAFVRSEYFDATRHDDLYPGPTEPAFATMYRNDRYKLVVYHSQNDGELYDLVADPGETNNLWDDPAHAAARNRLILESFNATVIGSIDMGTRRIGPM
jgi:arylsulfatase